MNIEGTVILNENMWVRDAPLGNKIGTLGPGTQIKADMYAIVESWSGTWLRLTEVNGNSTASKPTEWWAAANRGGAVYIQWSEVDVTPPPTDIPPQVPDRVVLIYNGVEYGFIPENQTGL